jgi:tRNA A37 methylthiotransferase MiaB
MMSPQSLAPIVSEFLKVLRSERFYRFLHLPVQSGSDSVLRRMSRGYRALDFREIVASARAVLPDLMLATDVIIGFPGETDEDFRATLDLLREVGPDLVNVTRFSPRPLTPAGGMLPVPSATVKRRSREITSLRQEQSRARFEQWIGRTERILIVENGIEQSSMGRLPNYLPVVVDRTLPIGAETSVRIEGARSTYLLGEPVGPLENRPAPRAE